ncbi:MAG TPA: outer membrane protein transport protein [Bacteroidales bacterium]|nr:outer membrane protein transport protein [Bacteroidales bacterium]
MKRITLLFIGILIVPLFSYSGGIVTNQNQSAAYIRMFARDASTDIDAVFFNPAGLTKLSDGFHFSLNNQYILQNKYVTSHYPYLNNNPVEYQGEVSVPLFPGIYGAYKKGNFTLSLGINPVGGGGSATFNNGLPSFEVPVSNLVPTLSAQGQPVSDYGLNAYFEGSSVYWGYQFGASYAFNDMFSAYLGIRYVSAKNTYNGYLKDITITLGGTETPAAAYFESTAAAIQPLNDGLNNLSDGGAGSFTLDEAYGASIIDTETYNQLSAGYNNFGLDPSVHTIDQGYSVVNDTYNETRTAAYVLQDQDNVEVEQTGSGFAPIIGVNISPSDRLNIGLKYEFKTKLELENNTTKDFIIDYDPVNDIETGMFPDGEKIRNDMPAMFSAGFDYQITDRLSVASGFHMYFDKNANYGKKVNGIYVDNDEVIDRNSTEFALGIEYNVSEKLLLSIGYLHTETGVTEDYQTDLSYSNHSNSIGIGGGYAIKPGINLNLGIGYTTYNDARKIYSAQDPLGGTLTTMEEYDKDNLFVALGMDFKFGK